MTDRTYVWNQAALRHRETPRKYKPVGPVGELPPVLLNMTPTERATGHTSTCEACGYHTCGCKQREQMHGAKLATQLQRDLATVHSWVPLLRRVRLLDTYTTLDDLA